MINKPTTYEFFDLVLSGELGELDIDNYIQEATNNYDIKKLKTLLNDIEYCYYVEKDEKEAEYDEKQIADAIREFEKKKLEIPYKYFREIRYKNGQISKASKILDLEKLLFPYDFFTIYKLINKIKTHIKAVELPLANKREATKLDIEFDKLTEKYKDKFGHELPFGAFIFNEIKEQIEKVEDNSVRLVEYKKRLHFWQYTLLTDSNVIGETEIINRIIPLISNEIRLLEGLQPQITEIQIEPTEKAENDFTLSTIEDWLFEFKEKMSEADYENLVSALMHYFETGLFPTLSKPIQINGRPNKKLFGWALNRIFEAKGKGVEPKLLKFAKQNISLFADVEFNENNILKSNLYKYFTTKTK
jgi:hypothetical protein